MLFNSYEFVFFFVPVVLAGFFLLGRVSRVWALRGLILASLGFYAWWRPMNVFIIAPSILINFGLARGIQLLLAHRRPGAARAVLAAGIVFNVLFLGYFKYANFGATALNDLLGTHLVLTQIVLPLGISFITFQKIAFLVDVHGGRVERFSFQDYALFVLFFPQLVAGPIVHYREMMPQFHKATARIDLTDLSVGVTLFLFGLFKKVVLADGIAPHVTPIYGQATLGEAVSLLPAWGAAIGFTLQIYFDFSGYTDMALGLARAVGITFPPNFNSPLKATSIIDFWQRWHMTLTRFLTAYIYNPLALWLTRRRMARGLAGFSGRHRSVGAFIQIVAFPTLLTMFISGLWHGAGYLFIAWGLAHGAFLVINHSWRLVSPRLFPNRERYERIMRPLGFALTFLSVVVAMVLFRSTTVRGAGIVLSGLVGGQGVALPSSVMSQLGSAGEALQRIGVGTGLGVEVDFLRLVAWTMGLLAVALLCPNTLQLLRRYRPALGYENESSLGATARTPAWAPSLAWAGAVVVLGSIGILRLGGLSEFLYWQF